MASERQIAANRRNARKSTGPRSASGKKRSSKNAFRHGLSKPLSGAEFILERETLAHQIAGDVKHPLAIELARDAAEAQLELARLRHFKADLIDRVAAFGSLEAPEIARLSGEEIWIMEELYPNRFLGKSPEPAFAGLPSPPVEKSDSTAEAIRLALPELVKFVRYETRAAARRDRAMRAVARTKAKSSDLM